jgi:hypothetical protein
VPILRAKSCLKQLTPQKNNQISLTLYNKNLANKFLREIDIPQIGFEAI